MQRAEKCEKTDSWDYKDLWLKYYIMWLSKVSHSFVVEIYKSPRVYLGLGRDGSRSCQGWVGLGYDSV